MSDRSFIARNTGFSVTYAPYKPTYGGSDTTTGRADGDRAIWKIVRKIIDE
jgi:hypothetical protein